MHSNSHTLSTTPRQAWHRGELAIQEKLGVAVTDGWSWHSGHIPEEQRIFHTSKLSFLPLTTLERGGNQRRPWVSIVTPRTYGSGFVSSPDEHTLVVDIAARTGDPIIENIRTTNKGDEDIHLVVGLGIEFATRRRNKFAGSMHVERLTSEGDDYRMVMAVNQAIGNCPKYITIRDLVPDSSPARVVYEVRNMSGTDHLPDGLVLFIHECDTVFLGTSYEATEQESKKTPSQVGINHRGGRPGFIRVRNDKRTIVMPDYTGNRLYTSLGNIEASSLAAISLISFDTGDVLYLTGEATNIAGSAAQAIMPSQEILTTLRITGYIFVSSSLPLRQNPSARAERSPYSPPIKLLAEERHDLLSSSSDNNGEVEDVYATLHRVTFHAFALATLEFALSRPIRAVRPGQAAILDFSSLVGKVDYSYTREHDPQGLNDTRMRTWTVSDTDVWERGDGNAVGSGGNNHEERQMSKFSLTMREKKGGRITGMLFRAIRKLKDRSTTTTRLDGTLHDAKSLGIVVKLVGVGGDFVIGHGVPSSSPNGRTNKRADIFDDHERFLWIAGGIGITPFLAMLSSFVGLPQPATTGSNAPEKNHKSKNVHFILSTREPDILLSLISHALTPYPSGPDQDQSQKDNAANGQTQILLLIDIFTPPDAVYDTDIIISPPTGKPRAGIEVRRHTGRIPSDFFASASQVERDHLNKARVYLCGPHRFENDMISALGRAGYEADRVVRENFDY